MPVFAAGELLGMSRFAAVVQLEAVAELKPPEGVVPVAEHDGKESYWGFANFDSSSCPVADW